MTSKTLRQIHYGGKDITSEITASFTNTHWSVGATEGWAAQMANLLKTINKFKVEGKIQGDLDSPKITMRSDLDEQLKQAVAGQLKNAQNELKQKLQARLDAEVKQAAGPYKEQLAFLTQSEGTTEQRISQLDEMLKAQLKSAVDQQKQQTTDKLKEKIKGLKF